ncbi:MULTISPECIES: phosphopantetheine-binding protein [unclassified Microbacterium]|uniref:phosphopantetheine-binding protein n=1 Tax=unclassified Microbacterium TaxID=2609290 RepID=UPI000CFDE6FF|nr:MULTISPECIES: phosphopantetheine-binding protein [unclassified Microbacterium]PQZ53028.1 hypothetical protein CQ032_16270 [Microbacterium sp. MYb43]PQZ73256.1 hypothetical protein CQ031_17625 [Microbacterium sp. MYb40]PRB18724.1 hypothetical protein CQ040_16750 [Microbacterium sp. MYb54]PRB24383.1 hypothetical protein CQ037_17045 [Microbacterium sp. MYb50]PRB64431.1 hypothetical protein CQ027_19995 [Microbacterium sp. MYb32]
MTEIASIVRDAWANALELSLGDDGEHFFELGGSSLQAAMFVADLRDKGINVSLATIFEDGRLSAVIEQASFDEHA